MSHTNFCYWNVVFAILLKSPFYGNSRIRSINSVFTKFWAVISVAKLFESSLHVKKFLLIRIKSLWQRLIHNNTTILSSGRRLVKFFREVRRLWLRGTGWPPPGSPTWPQVTKPTTQNLNYDLSKSLWLVKFHCVSFRSKNCQILTLKPTSQISRMPEETNNYYVSVKHEQ